MIQKLNKQDLNLQEWEYEYQQRGEQPILLSDFFCRSFFQYLGSTLSGVATPRDTLFTDSSKGYDKLLQRKRLVDQLKEKSNDTASLQEILKNSIEVPKSFNALADTVTTALKNGAITNQQLAIFWKQMDEDFIKVVPWFYYPWYLSQENILTDKVKQGLESYRVEIEKLCSFDEALLALVFPIKKTAFQLEQEDMLTLVHLAERDDRFSENQEFKNAATEYLKKYDWLTTFILMPILPMSYEQLVERVAKAKEESFVDTIALQKQATQKNEDLAQRLVEFLKDDAKVLGYIADARELGYALTAGIEEAYVSSSRYLDFMQLVAKRIGVVFEDTKYLLSEEIYEALNTSQPVSSQIIEERKRGFVMMTQDGKQSVLFGEEGHAMSVQIDTHFSKVDESIKELKGQVACNGFAKGKAHVANNPEETRTLVEGEILVCPMTNPDYVPAMRRAAAIVTDEGGLLSHAAIMSREFNKPCVIATKIATRLIKTGDMLEVDAIHGIVKILK